MQTTLNILAIVTGFGFPILFAVVVCLSIDDAYRTEPPRHRRRPRWTPGRGPEAYWRASGYKKD